MSTIFTFAKFELLTFFRNKGDLFWAFAFPVLMLGLSLVVFGGMVPEGLSKALVTCKNVMVIVLSASCFFSIGSHVATMRENQTLLHYHTTPVKPQVILLGIMLRQLFIALINLCFVFCLTILIFQPDLSMVDLPALGLTFLAAGFAFTGLGMILAALARSQEQAIWIANALFLPFMFLSGSTVPTNLFPEWLQTISNLIPSTHLEVILSNILFYEEGLAEAGNLKILTIFIGIGVVCTFISAKTFRWSA